MDCTITLHNEVSCNVRGLKGPDTKALFELWALKVQNAHFMPAVRQGKWDGRINFVKANGNTSINLLPAITEWLRFRGYNINLVDNRLEQPESPNLITSTFFEQYDVTLRWYQVKAVNAAIKYSNAVLDLATGAGKSYINAAIVGAYDLPSITIVPSTDLVVQTSDTFKTVGLDTGMFYGKVKQPECQHVVSTWQSLQRHRDVLLDRKVLVLDECHQISGQTIANIAVEGNGALIPYRFGLTGTIPKSKADRTTLKSAFGEIRYKLGAKELQDQGFLSNLFIHIKQMQDAPDFLIKKPKFKPGDIDAQKAAWQREKSFLTTNKQRIQHIAKFIESVAPESGNTLILVNGVAAGKKIAEILGCNFISGKTKTSDRANEYSNFEEAQGKKTVATFGVASTGIDITNVHCVILIDAGKSFTKTIQSIGRGLRKGDSKYFADIFDWSSNSYYSKKHVLERIKYYEEAQYPFDFEKL